MTHYLPRDDAVTYDRYLKRQERLAQMRKARREPALQRAETLLLGCLEDYQVMSWEARGWFTVTAESGTRYMLCDRSDVGPLILRFDRGNDDLFRALTGFCFHAPHDEPWPAADILLTYKLWIESDEEKFLAHANAHTVHVSWAVWAQQEIEAFSTLSDLAQASSQLCESINPRDRLVGARLWVLAYLQFWKCVPKEMTSLADLLDHAREGNNA